MNRTAQQSIQLIAISVCTIVQLEPEVAKAVPFFCLCHSTYKGFSDYGLIAGCIFFPFQYDQETSKMYTVLALAVNMLAITVLVDTKRIRSQRESTPHHTIAFFKKSGRM